MKKKDIDWKSQYHWVESHNSLLLKEVRESNMAFDELLSRVVVTNSDVIQYAFYELKEAKIKLKELQNTQFKSTKKEKRC